MTCEKILILYYGLVSLSFRQSVYPSKLSDLKYLNKYISTDCLQVLIIVIVFLNSTHALSGSWSLAC